MDYQVRPKKDHFAAASLVLGALALLSVGTIILPIPLGALSILFAVLSHQKGQKIGGSRIAGIAASVLGIIISISIAVSAIAMLPTMLKTPAYRDQLNKISEQLYGESFDDMIEGIYGVDPDDLFDFD